MLILKLYSFIFFFSKFDTSGVKGLNLFDYFFNKKYFIDFKTLFLTKNVYLSYPVFVLGKSGLNHKFCNASHKRRNFAYFRKNCIPKKKIIYV